MNGAVLRQTPRLLVMLVVSTLALLVFVAPASAAGPDTVRDQAKGAAYSGVADTFGKVLVHQIDVQVVAGPKDTRENSTQTTSNVAVVGQDTFATSGDASASDGGVAVTGDAKAKSLAIVNQINIQIIAGHAPSGGVTQDATNYAEVDQTTGAVSGDASASGSGSVATSGDASASAVAVVNQRNIQVFVGKPHGSDAPVVQEATNVASVAQETIAVSGDTVATDGAKAESGKARAKARAIVEQTNRQIKK